MGPADSLTCIAALPSTRRPADAGLHRPRSRTSSSRQFGPDHVHLLVQAKQLAYHDRDRWLADLRFAEVPTERHLQTVCRYRRNLIDRGSALPWDKVPSYGSLGPRRAHVARSARPTATPRLLIFSLCNFGSCVTSASVTLTWPSGRFRLGEPRDTLHIEARFPRETIDELERRGHPVDRWGDWNELAGHAHGITLGLLAGGFDPRSDGAAAGYEPMFDLTPEIEELNEIKRLEDLPRGGVSAARAGRAAAPACRLQQGYGATFSTIETVVK